MLHLPKKMLCLLPCQAKLLIYEFAGIAVESVHHSEARQRTTKLNASCFFPSEAHQLELVSRGVRCAMLFERGLNASHLRALVLSPTCTLCFDGNIFAISLPRLFERVTSLAVDVLELRACPSSESSLPLLVFAGSHLSRPELASDSYHRAWARRLLSVARIILSEAAAAVLEKRVANFSSDAHFDGHVTVCPVSLTGWLLEYPCVYDVCGPYPDVLDGGHAMLDSIRYAPALACYHDIARMAFGDGATFSTKALADQTERAHVAVPMRAGNCLTAVPLMLLAALFKIVPLSRGSGITSAESEALTSEHLTTCTAISFSIPLCMYPVAQARVAQWKLQVRQRLRRSMCHTLHEESSSVPESRHASTCGLIYARIDFVEERRDLDAVSL